MQAQHSAAVVLWLACVCALTPPPTQKRVAAPRSALFDGIPVGLQLCRKCSATKPVDDFPRKKSHPDGRDDYCKACHASATKARVALRGPVKEPTVESKVCS